ARVGQDRADLAVEVDALRAGASGLAASGGLAGDHVDKCRSRQEENPQNASDHGCIIARLTLFSTGAWKTTKPIAPRIDANRHDNRIATRSFQQGQRVMNVHLGSRRLVQFLMLASVVRYTGLAQQAIRPQKQPEPGGDFTIRLNLN